MSTDVSAAYIAGAVSLVTALVTVLLTRWQTRRALHGAFATKLQELRLHHYPEAFKITERLGKRLQDSDESLPSIFNEIGRELAAWRSGVPGLIMSAAALQGFYRIQEALHSKLAKGTRYSGEQLVRIREARTEFRNALRADVGLEPDTPIPTPDWVAKDLESKKKPNPAVQGTLRDKAAQRP